MCDKNGPQITIGEKQLLRQVNPEWLDDEGEPSSQNFYPFRDIDQACLSVDRQELITAESAYVLFTSPLPDGFGKKSRGVWELLVSEISHLGLTAWEDPRVADEHGPANPAHAVVEFGVTSTSKWKAIGKKLKKIVIDRGRRYPPPSPPQVAAPEA